MGRLLYRGLLTGITTAILVSVAAGVAFVWSGFHYLEGTANSTDELARRSDLRGLGNHVPPSIRDIRFIVQPYRDYLRIEGSINCRDAKTWVSQNLIVKESLDAPFERGVETVGQGFQSMRIAKGFYADGVFQADEELRCIITCDGDSHRAFVVVFRTR